MDRAFMLKCVKDYRNKPWFKRREWADLRSDPSVVDMIKAIQPLMGPVQESWTRCYIRTSPRMLQPSAS
ncbi:hypothetical protein [Mycobacterium sp. 23]|uniref:hypothetical protein n=1 Tax=Mycobacterium sp. 23 TaxID=3400424 RepID=UPI003AAF03A1